MSTVDEAVKVMEQAKQEIFRLRATNDQLVDILEEVRDLIEGYVDVSDGDYGQPVPNKAMRAVQLIDGAPTK